MNDLPAGYLSAVLTQTVTSAGNPYQITSELVTHRSKSSPKPVAADWHTIPVGFNVTNTRESEREGEDPDTVDHIQEVSYTGPAPTKLTITE